MARDGQPGKQTENNCGTTDGANEDAFIHMHGMGALARPLSTLPAMERSDAKPRDLQI
jgi:hypothetical protein